MAVMAFVVFGRSTLNFSKRARSHHEPIFFRVHLVMMVPWIVQMEHATDRKIRKAGRTTAHENVDFSKFHEILKLVTVFDEKNHNFFSLARISLSRGAAVHISSDS